MIAETIGLGTVAVGALGVATLVIKKHFEYAAKIRASLDKNSDILQELKELLYKINGK